MYYLKVLVYFTILELGYEVRGRSNISCTHHEIFVQTEVPSSNYIIKQAAVVCSEIQSNNTASTEVSMCCSYCSQYLIGLFWFPGSKLLL